MSHNGAQRPKRSQEELDNFVRAFRYEVEMLVSQGLLYLDHGSEIVEDRSDGRQVAADALLDSLLNRLRAFDEFFGHARPKDSDARASDPDLTTGWEPRRTLEPATRQIISRRLSHLTYDRPPEHVWEIGIMIRLALERIRDFLCTSRVDDESWNSLLESVDSTLDDWGDRDKICTSPNQHAFWAGPAH